MLAHALLLLVLPVVVMSMDGNAPINDDALDLSFLDDNWEALFDAPSPELHDLSETVHPNYEDGTDYNPRSSKKPRPASLVFDEAPYYYESDMNLLDDTPLDSPKSIPEDFHSVLNSAPIVVNPPFVGSSSTKKRKSGKLFDRTPVGQAGLPVGPVESRFTAEEDALLLTFQGDPDLQKLNAFWGKQGTLLYSSSMLVPRIFTHYPATLKKRLLSLRGHSNPSSRLIMENESSLLTFDELDLLDDFPGPFDDLAMFIEYWRIEGTKRMLQGQLIYNHPSYQMKKHWLVAKRKHPSSK